MSVGSVGEASSNRRNMAAYVGWTDEAARAGDEVRMVVVSDVHGEVAQAHRAVAWVADNGVALDVVVVLGDLANIKTAEMEQPAAAMAAEGFRATTILR